MQKKENFIAYREEMACQLCTDLYLSPPHEFEVFDGPSYDYRKDTIKEYDDNALSFSFRLSDTDRVFYIVRRHTPNYDELVMKVKRGSPLRVTVWSHTPSVDITHDVDDLYIAIVREIEEVRVITSLETKIFFSDGQHAVIQMSDLGVVRNIVTVMMDHFNNDEKATLFFNEFLSRSCKTCGKYSRKNERCLKCKEPVCKKCLFTMNKHLC